MTLAGTYLSVGLASPLMSWSVTGEWPWPTAAMWWTGTKYTAFLIAILGAHEAGHYFQIRRFGIPATFPLFIPFPLSPFGTMGAVIVQRGGMADRRQLFDIAVSGPLAGLCIALPVLYYGIATAPLASADAFVSLQAYVEYGQPLLVQGMMRWFYGTDGAAQHLMIHPHCSLAGLDLHHRPDLLPIGQLDGGHLLYTLIGRPARWVAIGLLLAIAAWMLVTWQFDYLLIVLLLLCFGPRHPPTANDNIPLGAGRHVLGWLTLLFLVIGLTPQPIITFQPLLP